MKNRFFVCLMILHAIAGEWAAAETIRILYRPSLTVEEVFQHAIHADKGSSWSQLWKKSGWSDNRETWRSLLSGDPRTWGHVAIQLPRGAFGRDGRVFGWQIDPVASTAEAERLGTTENDVFSSIFQDWRQGNFRRMKGSFGRFDQWAGSLDFPPAGQLREWSIEVSEVELGRIVSRMKALEQDSYYQLPAWEGPMFGERSYNCVSALGVILEGIDHGLPEKAFEGSLGGFIRHADEAPRPEFCAQSFSRVVPLNDPAG